MLYTPVGGRARCGFGDVSVPERVVREAGDQDWLVAMLDRVEAMLDRVEADADRSPD